MVANSGGACRLRRRFRMCHAVQEADSAELLPPVAGRSSESRLENLRRDWWTHQDLNLETLVLGTASDPEPAQSNPTSLD